MRLPDVCINRPTPRALDPNRPTSSASRRGREGRLTALLPLRRASLAALARASERFASLRRRRLLAGTRVARCPYRRLLREAASSAPRGRRFGPLGGRARLPLTPPVAPGTEVPDVKDRRGLPPVKEAGCFDPRAPSHRTNARALAGFCNRERFTSTAANRLDPAPPVRGCPRPGPPGRRCLSRGIAGRASRLRGVGRSLSRGPPPTRRTQWDYPKTDLPEHPCRPLVARPAGGADLAEARRPLLRASPPPARAGRAGGSSLSRRSRREAGSTRSSAKRSAVSPSLGCFRNEGDGPPSAGAFVPRLLPTWGWTTSVAVRVALALVT
jgi:hypothetical protein